MRHVDADELVEGLLVEKRAHELTLATPQIEDALGSALRERRNDRSNALLVEAYAFLAFRRLDVVGGEPFLGHELLERVARETPLVLQIPPRDEVTLGMHRKPALAAANQLVDLVVADPIVLLVVEYGHEHV